MRVVDFVPRRRLRLLGAMTLAAIGAVAWRAAHRTPAPPPAPPLIVCAIPEVPPAPPPKAQPPDEIRRVVPPPPPQRFAVPPPGDPYPRHVIETPRPVVALEATVVRLPRDLPGCGVLEIWGWVTVRGLRDGLTHHVQVECPELLEVGGRYVFWIGEDRLGEPDWRATSVSRR